MDYNKEQFFQEETIDVKKYLFKVLHNWHWFLISLILAIAAAYYINRFSEPVYNVGGATVMVRHERMRPGGMEGFIESFELVQSRTTIQNHIEILRSYTLSRRAMEELDFGITYVAMGRFKNSKMYKNSDIRVHQDTTRYQRKGYPVYVTILNEDEYRLEIDDDIGVNRIMKFGEQFEHEMFSFNITLENNDYTHEKYYFTINDLNSLASRYRNNLEIEVNDPQTGSVLFLSSTGKVPGQEVNYLNKLMELFIRTDLEEKNQTAINTIDFIDEQLIDITDSLNRVENELEQFRLEHKIMNLSHEGQLVFNKLESFHSEKVELNIKQNYFDYLLNYLSDKTSYNDIIAPSAIGIADPLLNSLIDQLNQLHNEHNMLSFNVKKDNPRLVKLEKTIESSSQVLRENLQSMVAANQIAMKDVKNRIEKVEGEVMELPLRERQMLGKERRFELNNELYTYLMEKRAEASIAKAANISDNKVLDFARAENATMVTPKKNRNYFLALFAGLGLPVLLILLRDFFNTKINEISEIENKINLPIIGNISNNRFKTEIPVFVYPKSAIAESFRGMRTNLQYLLKKDKKHVISITSAVAGEGKTFCAINLSFIIAMTGKKTLLAGLDLRKPMINSILSVEDSCGLSTYLIGNNSADEIIKKTDNEFLDIISSGPLPPNPAELLQSERMEELVSLMKKRYDYIIFDTPPVAFVSDAIIASTYSDLTMFVIRQNFSNKHVVNLVNDLKNKKDFTNMSLLINDIKIPGYYGYGYYSFSNRQYKNHGYYGEDDKPQGFSAKVKQFFNS